MQAAVRVGAALLRPGRSRGATPGGAGRRLRNHSVLALGDKRPRVHPEAFVAHGAVVVGDVRVGAGSSVWYGCVLRGDVNHIAIGENSNLQDGTIVHVAKNNPKGDVLPTVIGDNVTVGHSALLHACTLESESFVGMRATVLDGAVVQRGAMVAAGAMVTAGKTVPTGELWAGSPAKFFRKLRDNEIAFFKTSAEKYAELGREHRLGAAVVGEADEPTRNDFGGSVVA